MLLTAALQSLRGTPIPLGIRRMPFVNIVCGSLEYATFCVSNPAHRVYLRLGLVEANGAPQLEVKSKESLTFLRGWSRFIVLLRAGYGGAEFAGTYPAVSVQV